MRIAILKSLVKYFDIIHGFTLEDSHMAKLNIKKVAVIKHPKFDNLKIESLKLAIQTQKKSRQLIKSHNLKKQNTRKILCFDHSKLS